MSPARLIVMALALAAAPLAGCLGDPPRDNPFDPESDTFRDVGQATGVVTRFYSPEGIAGARVRLVPLGGEGVELVTQTGPDGRFLLEDVPTGRYLVVAGADGFATATDTLDVPLGDVAEEARFALDGVPAVVEQAVRTEHIERWWPRDPLHNLIVDVRVTDPDGLGDVDGVQVGVPGLGFSDTLQVVPGEPDRYTRTFDDAELPAPLSSFLGRAIEVEVTDRVGVTGFAPGVQVLRIIDTVPQLLSPLSGSVGPTPELVWVPLALPYAFTYTVAIALVPAPGQQVAVATFEGLPPSQAALQITDPLPNGDYIWTVSAVDDFGNRSQSLSAQFLVVSALAP